jgi:uncharacterized surface protein with fasciclin (FAS1) repeats
VAAAADKSFGSVSRGTREAGPRKAAPPFNPFLRRCVMKMYVASGLVLVGLVAVGVVFAQAGADTAKDAKPAAEAAQPKSIVETAVGNKSFSTLVKALKAASLVEPLQGKGPFTVFAPTDEAFAKLPEGTLEKLLADKEALTEILKYHVVAGKVTASDVVKLKSAKTLADKEVSIDTEEGVKINDATVVKADVMCTNGVIHVIDTVLIPKSE